MLERCAIFGYLVVVLTLAYYPRRQRDASAGEVSGGSGRARAPVSLAVPTLVGAPALVFALATEVRAGLLVALVSATVAVALLLLDRSKKAGGLWQGIGRAKGGRSIASRVVSDVMALVRFVFFGAVGGAVLARWLGVQPGLLGLLLVLTLGLMVIPDWPRSVERVDWFHGVLWLALAMVGVAAGLASRLARGMLAQPSGPAVDAEWLWIAGFALILSAWFWLDDAFVLSRLERVSAELRARALTGVGIVQFAAIVAAAVSWPFVARFSGEASFAEQAGTLNLFRRGIFAVIGASAILSVMMGSLHTAVGHLAGNSLVSRMPGTDGLHARLVAAALIVAVLPAVEVVARFPSVASWVAVLSTVVLVPPIFARRVLLGIFPDAQETALRWVPAFGFLFGFALAVTWLVRGVENEGSVWARVGVLCFLIPLAMGSLLKWGSHLYRARGVLPVHRAWETRQGKVQGGGEATPNDCCRESVGLNQRRR